MINKGLKLPLYAQATIYLVGIFALFAILYITRSILVPLVFAFIIAIVLSPVVDFLVRRKINRVISIIITLVLSLSVIVALVMVMISQVSRFAETWPVFVENITALLNHVIIWASDYFDIKPQKIHLWIENAKADFGNVNSAELGQTLSAIGSFIVYLLLVPVYTFLILFYQPLLLEFIQRLFQKSNHSRLRDVIIQIKTVIQRYLIGLIIETAIIATLEIATLLILGIDYAILLGILGALLNLIPYIGGIIAVALPMTVALATKDSAAYALYILMIYYIIQLVDNNYIVPKIVASKVKLNALFSIVVVFVGNALWGVPGMFLSIPLLAIVKLIFDNIESWKPWGFLLGDTMPSILEIKPLLKKSKPKADKDKG